MNKFTTEYIEEMITNYEEWVYRALKILHKKQTPEEKRGEHPNTKNGVGFNKFDAPNGMKYAETILSGGKLNFFQIKIARKIVLKYVVQLTRLANKEI